MPAINPATGRDEEGVEPIRDFDLKKYRLAESVDAVATLDSRPDLMQIEL